MNKYIKLILSELARFNPVVTVASTGSTYIEFSGSKVKCVRVANHTGHKLARNVWQLRTDAMTARGKNNNRIYNVNAINQLIAEFK
jgi:hypothetical protein